MGEDDQRTQDGNRTQADWEADFAFGEMRTTEPVHESDEPTHFDSPTQNKQR
ncbi:unnamed protein product [Ectocarpus sp. CCAP 1310/34]|nr:unnamed protein product [Ectocarpus sp. CCAP 1310/34]